MEDSIAVPQRTEQGPDAIPASSNAAAVRSIVVPSEARSRMTVLEEWVDLPEMGGPGTGVYVRSMTARQRDRFEEGLVKGKGAATKISMDNVRAKVAVLCCYDAPAPGGQRVFAPADEVWLGDQAASILDRIYAAANRDKGLSDADVEELVDFSGRALSDVSSSG